MKQIKYTPDAAEKLRAINRAILLQYGRDKAKEVIGNITGTIRKLVYYEQLGLSVESMFGVETEYRYIYASNNYIFYGIESDCIRIINLYHEKEDFMWLLFGIDTTPPETIGYWNES